MKAEMASETQKQIEQMTEAFRKKLKELYEWSNAGEVEKSPTAVEIENEISAWIHQIGNDTQKMVLEKMDQRRAKGKKKCPKCGEKVYWKRYEVRNYITSLGEMKLERAYYYHAACHCGWIPLDEQLGLGASELSERVQEMVSYLGAFMPFEQAKTYLSKYCGVEISHDTVNNTTIAIGRALKEKQEQAVQQAWATGLLPDCAVTSPPQRLYVSADGIKHLLPDGSGKEIRVAAIYETKERQNRRGETEIHAVRITYVAHSDSEQLARAAYLIARQRGVEAAEQIVVLGDGAIWIWNRIAILFPRQKTTEIVDFYHASEYIWDVANSVWGRETPAAQDWGVQFCHDLKHKGPAPVLKALRKLSSSSPSVFEPVTSAITYFDNQGQRMDYPSYIERGFQIGSGSAESAVNQVVGVRMNQTGMRWNANRAEAVAHVRAAILSNRWDDFWSSFSPSLRHYNHSSLPTAA